MRGELKFDASRIGDDALRAGSVVTVTMPDGSVREMTVAAVRRHQDRPLLRFTGVDDANAADAFTNATLTIARSAAPLHAGEYFEDDLIGCRLIDEAGIQRGVVTGVLHYPIQDMLVVGSTTTLLPMVAAFIARVDIARKEIHVTVPPGLLDPDAAAEA